MIRHGRRAAQRIAKVARQSAVVALAVLTLVPSALATWSIVVVDTRTGEVAVAGATCLPNVSLKNKLAVILVGRGCASAQSAIDASGANRAFIVEHMLAGWTPDQILQGLATFDSQPQSRQYGIVTMGDLPATFTGTNAGLARAGVVGVVGDLRYAIQGNVLAGDIVVTAAETALLTTPGDLSQKVMAAMDAARAMGGDGRCSCHGPTPYACGAPPPSFDYSSYTAFIVVARIGDVDGSCFVNGPGCANGSYWCDLKAVSLQGGPEPVEFLARKYDEWRNDLHGVADHLQTRVTANAQSLVADGHTSLDVEVELRDVEGVAVTLNPATLTIVPTGATPSIATVGPAVDLGSGRFRFPVIASSVAGVQTFGITVVHAAKSVRLSPDVAVRIDPLTPLHCGFDRVSAGAGARVPLVVNLGPAATGDPYAVFGSASGTTPGVVFRGVSLPLNADDFFRRSVFGAGALRFQGTIGALDLDGRAQAMFVASPGLLDPWIGRRIDWAAIVLGQATNVAGFDVMR